MRRAAQRESKEEKKKLALWEKNPQRIHAMGFKRIHATKMLYLLVFKRMRFQKDTRHTNGVSFGHQCILRELKRYTMVRRRIHPYIYYSTVVIHSMNDLILSPLII